MTVARRLSSRLSDDWAYALPMAVFLWFTFMGGTWPALFPLSYVFKAVVAAALLIWLWPRFTRVRWDYWWLGLLLGVVGIFQWVGMQLWLQNTFDWFKPKPDAFDPFAQGWSPGVTWAFIAVRVAGATLVVPVMEELFWRDYLWRRIAAPNDFKLAAVGEWDRVAFLVVPLVFATVHGNWWPTAIVWGLMIGALLAYTKSLGACIVMHATTNALLAAYVLHTGDWAFW